MKIGVLGGGQLGRMLALAGYPLGFRFRFLDPSPNSPAGQLAERVVGEYDDPAALERFVSGLDRVTFEFENVPVETLQTVERHAPVDPSAAALAAAQDRLPEKQLFRKLGIATAEFAPVESRDELEAAVKRIGLPAVLKTRRCGYDGRGQHVLRSPEDVDAAWERLGGVPLLLEGWVPFERELSVIGARSRHGEMVFYPLIQNEHRDGILRVSHAPAPELDSALQTDAERHAAAVLEALEYVGVLTIEFFQAGGRLVANEMAPRVHNSGHWTIEGAETSQFENHLRAVAGLPLGSTGPRGHAAMINLIGDLPDPAKVLSVSGAHLHLYGKCPRPGRKLGHVTLRHESFLELERRVRELQQHLPAG